MAAVLVTLGNPAPKTVTGNRVTSVVIPDSYTLTEAVAVITAADGVWNNHTEGDNVDDVKPDWVHSDNPMLADLLASHFGCASKRPKSWHENVDAAEQAEDETEDDK